MTDVGPPEIVDRRRLRCWRPPISSFCVQPAVGQAIAGMTQGRVLVGKLQRQGGPPPAPKRCRPAASSRSQLERLPRTTRAQALDILSSQAGLAGYKALLISPRVAPRFFPMLTTADGTIRPSKVLVIGAGVAGLQAIATAKRLGAQVEGFDVRPETREQIESLGGKFLDLGVSAAGEGGYARQLTDEERALQQQRLADHLKNIDVIVATAAVPGRPAPKIVSAAMVAGMKPGSVIVDLAAETGGNCELTRPGDNVVHRRESPAAEPRLSGAMHATTCSRATFHFVSCCEHKAAEVRLNDELRRRGLAGTRAG